MRRLNRFFALFLVLLFLPCLASATSDYYGVVVCETTAAETAPFGGMVSGLKARKGDLVHAGDLLCTLETKKVYAPVAGTVSGVFGEPGDITEDVKTRRGGVVYIIPEAHYIINANYSRADKNPENYIGVGQQVWINKERGAIVGTGTVISIAAEADSEGKYTVELTSGEFSLTEKVVIYRDKAMEWNTGMGYGTVALAPDIAVTGEGSILKMHVKPGDPVKRGDLLFETVSGQLDGMKSRDNTLRSTVTGIVKNVETSNGASVEQGAMLLSVCPLEDLQVCATIPETDLTLLPPGTPVRLQFSGNLVREGKVSSVSYLAEGEEGSSSSAGYAQYKVYFDFEDKEDVRQGMFVTIEILSADEPAEEKEN